MLDHFCSGRGKETFCRRGELQIPVLRKGMEISGLGKRTSSVAGEINPEKRAEKNSLVKEGEFLSRYGT